MGVPSFSVTDHRIAFDFFPNLPLAQMLLPLWLVAFSRLACDHDSLCCCADVIFQR